MLRLSSSDISSLLEVFEQKETKSGIMMNENKKTKTIYSKRVDAEVSNLDKTKI